MLVKLGIILYIPVTLFLVPRLITPLVAGSNLILEKKILKPNCVSLTINNKKFDNLREYEYLGNIITFNLHDEFDVKLN